MTGAFVSSTLVIMIKEKKAKVIMRHRGRRGNSFIRGRPPPTPPPLVVINDQQSADLMAVLFATVVVDLQSIPAANQPQVVSNRVSNEHAIFDIQNDLPPSYEECAPPKYEDVARNFV